jgi:hypothetical protein
MADLEQANSHLYFGGTQFDSGLGISNEFLATLSLTYFLRAWNLHSHAGRRTQTDYVWVKSEVDNIS